MANTREQFMRVRKIMNQQSETKPETKPEPDPKPEIEPEYLHRYWCDERLNWVSEGSPRHVEITFKESDLQEFQQITAQDLESARQLDALANDLLDLENRLKEQYEQIEDTRTGIASTIAELEEEHKKRLRQWLKGHGGTYHD